MSGAFYNENDPYAAKWLRNLINAGHISQGEVGEQSIRDVRPGKWNRAHFFAGIGGWDYGRRWGGT